MLVDGSGLGRVKDGQSEAIAPLLSLDFDIGVRNMFVFAVPHFQSIYFRHFVKHLQFLYFKVRRFHDRLVPALAALVFEAVDLAD